MTEEELNIRADEIIAKMTDEEKIAVCSGADFRHTKGFEQYGLPSIMMTAGPDGLRGPAQEESPDGLCGPVQATCFPAEVTAAQTWNRRLLYEEGRAVGEEALEQKAALVLGPGINIQRSPLCGRNYESYSEDPVVAGELGASYVSGMQTETGVGTGLGHYACRSQEYRQMQSDSRMDERTLREIYLRAFEKAVKKAQPAMILCAGNKVNGTYCSDNAHLLTEILRDDWGFKGAVVTDPGALNNRTDAFLAGCDLAMPGGSAWGEKEVLKALDYEEIDAEGGTQGPLRRSVDASAKRVVSLALRRSAALERSRDYSYDRTAHQETARRIAEEGAVLLKNENHILPLADPGGVLLVGAMASHLRCRGAGSPPVHPGRIRQLRDCFPEAAYVPGCDDEGNVTEESLAEVTRAAARAQRVIVVTGLPERYEPEGCDRKNLSIPVGHDRMIRAALAGCPAVIAVVLGGGPMKLSWFDDVPAVLYAGLCGQEGGEAIANLLTGRVNPSGKLTETWPMEEIDIPCYGFYGEADGSRESLCGAAAVRAAAAAGAGSVAGGKSAGTASDAGSCAEGRTVETAVRDRGDACRDAQYREGIYVGYRYYEKAGVRVRFPFGYGLSYTRFDYSDLRIDDRTVTVHVRNTGNMAGAEVVQLYVGNPQNGLYRPLKELRAFDKVFLKPGEEAILIFQLASRDFSLYQDGWRIPTGTYAVMVGASSQDIRLVQEVEVTGETIEADPDLMGPGPGPRILMPEKRTALPRAEIGVPPAALSPAGEGVSAGEGASGGCPPLQRERSAAEEEPPAAPGETEGEEAPQSREEPKERKVAEKEEPPAAPGETEGEGAGGSREEPEERKAAEKEEPPASSGETEGEGAGGSREEPKGTEAAEKEEPPAAPGETEGEGAGGSREEPKERKVAAEEEPPASSGETEGEGAPQSREEPRERKAAAAGLPLPAAGVPGAVSWYVRPSGQPALGEWKRIMGGQLPEESAPGLRKPDWNSSLADLAPYSRICRHILRRVGEKEIRKDGGGQDPVCRVPAATVPLRCLRIFHPKIRLFALWILLRSAGHRRR